MSLFSFLKKKLLERLCSTFAGKFQPAIEDGSIVNCSISIVQGKEFKKLPPAIFRFTQKRKEDAITFSRGQLGAENVEIGQLEFYIWSLDHTPTSRSCKALDTKDKNRILGITTIFGHDGGKLQDCDVRDPASYQYKPPTVNTDFILYRNREIHRLKQKYLNGRRHICKQIYFCIHFRIHYSITDLFANSGFNYLGWGILCTIPDAQGDIVAEKLIRWGFQYFNLSNEVIITITENPGLFITVNPLPVDIT
jgi:hypothetical protein